MTLLILAAGMGSRYGGIKQIEHVGPNKELIIDYSIHDAVAAGFTRVVFVIRRDIEKDFREAIFNRIEAQGKIKAEYVFQDMTDLPSGFSAPKTRLKPWGTGHAILAARHIINEPFCAINADDFYGPQAFRKVAEYFAGKKTTHRYCIVGYKLVNTVSDSGTVSRGVCEVDACGQITDIKEFTKISQQNGVIIDNVTSTVLAPDTDVSVTFWGFTPDIFGLLETEFARFLERHTNLETGEFWITVTVGELIKTGIVTVELLTSKDTWLGMTYRQELPRIREAIANMKYPKFI